MRDPTAQTEPLTTGQLIVSEYERDMIAEPCELAEAIDKAIEAERDACAATVEAVTKAVIDWPLPGLVDANELTKRACAAAIRSRSGTQA